MTDARVRLIFLGMLSIILMLASAFLWASGQAVPGDLQALDTLVIGVFVGHVYMNGSGSGNGGPGAPKPPTTP